MTEFTSSLKRQITDDWAGMFPTLGVFKPMWLLRRVGPIVEGICLNRDSSNARYQPIFHVHNLAKIDSSLSLTLADELRTVRNNTPEKIKVAFHKDHYADAARRLNGQALLPVSGDLRVEEIIKAYSDYMERPLSKYPILLYEDVIMILVWCGRSSEAREALVRFERELAAWPESISALQRVGGGRAWLAKCEGWIEQPDGIRVTVEEQTVFHGLEKLPRAQLIS